MKKLIFLMFVGVLIIILTINYLISLDKKIDFETIAKGYYSDHKEPANYVINSDEELENLGIKTEIDFSQFSIIAVFMGEFNTGGYAIEIIEIIEKGDEIVVKVNKIYPKQGSLLTQAFSQPYHIIKTKKIDKKVIFENEN